MKVFILRFRNLHPNANVEYDTFYEIEQINEYEGIIKKLSSFLIISRTQNNHEKIFILNSSIDGILLKNNNKFANSILILNESILRIIEFSFQKEKIKPEVNIFYILYFLLKDFI